MHLSDSDFYRFPLAWLAGVAEAAALDARDLLLAHTHDGKVIFSDEQDEQAWFVNDTAAGLRGLFSRQTYAKHKNALLSQQHLCHYQRPPRPPSVTRAAHDDLYRPVKYTLTTWPPSAWFYRPRTYLLRRWPVWLGNSDLGSRAILVALFAKLAEQNTSASQPPTQITLKWQEITQQAAHLFAKLDGAPATEMVVKLRKGVQELRALGLLNEEAGVPLRYTLPLARLQGAPTWPSAELARSCSVELEQEEAWLSIVASLMTHCCEPVTRLQTVWNALRHQRTSPYLLDETDVNDLRKFVLSQRKQGRLPRHDEVLNDFMQNNRAQQQRVCSDPFFLPVETLALAQTTTNGAPIQMPAATQHGVEATQLWLRCKRQEGLTVAEAQSILAQVRLIVWQENPPQPPVAVPLVCHPPKPLSIDYGYILRANDLHQRLDYSRPLALILKCDQPDPRLTLHGRFRLLLSSSRR
jgi:hypothetical protein